MRSADSRPALRWSQALAQLEQQGEAYVLVTVISTRGSTPRNAGSKMLVTADQSYDTIGGGHLEFRAIAQARELLLGREAAQTLQHFPLGASLGQCCGGQATLLFEYFPARGVPLLVFGAGHVAKALLPILSQLPLRIRWIDSREEQFPAELPVGVERCLTDEPVEQIELASAGSYVLVLTHNHQLDYALTEAALSRGDLGFLGVIGSQTKALRFRQRLTHRGFSPAQLETFTCPVGLAEVAGKQPMEVAVSIAAQLIGLYQATQPPRPLRQGVGWQDMQQLLAPGETQQAAVSDATDKISTKEPT